MAINLNTQESIYEGLEGHIGHRIVVVSYGERDEIDNVALECETCGEVLMDADRPTSYEDESEKTGIIEDIVDSGSIVTLFLSDPWAVVHGAGNETRYALDALEIRVGDRVKYDYTPWGGLAWIAPMELASTARSWTG